MTYLAHYLIFFFFNDTATTEIYTLSLHDALPISELYETLIRVDCAGRVLPGLAQSWEGSGDRWTFTLRDDRSEEHTSELQSQSNLVCRLLLEKKKHITCR